MNIESSILFLKSIWRYPIRKRHNYIENLIQFCTAITFVIYKRLYFIMCLQLQKKYIQSRHINNINFFFFLLFCNFIYLHLRLSIPQRSIPFALLLCVLCLCTHCILTEEIIILATSERDESTSVNELLSRCQQVL